MFSAIVFPVGRVIWQEDGPVPIRPVNGYPKALSWPALGWRRIEERARRNLEHPIQAAQVTQVP